MASSAERVRNNPIRMRIHPNRRLKNRGVLTNRPGRIHTNRRLRTQGGRKRPRDRREPNRRLRTDGLGATENVNDRLVVRVKRLVQHYLLAPRAEATCWAAPPSCVALA